MSLPELSTARLLLRPFTLADAPHVRRYAGDYTVARETLTMPHPYEEGMAEAWMSEHAEAFARGHSLELAITSRTSGELLGAVGLLLDAVHSRGELGYWVARPFWGQGYASEAARAVMEFGFNQLGLVRVWAQHFSRNPASGRVMQKIGMRHEGRLRQHYRRFGELLDVEVYGRLAGERG